MMKQSLRIGVFLTLAFLICAPPCWAKTDGYLYVVGYSIAKKKVYFSSVIIEKVRDVSYSDEEFVTEVELIQKMEAQFQSHLAATTKLNPAEFTITVRGAYKSKAIADLRFKEERERFINRGFAAVVFTGFIYSD